MACADISEDKLFIGSIVTIFSRQLKLVDYGDTFTRNHFAANKESTFGLIKPDVYVHTGKIIDFIYQNGFTISKLKIGKFGPSTTQRFLQIGGQQNAEAS
jgi:nucleoside-diphosphate kinase